MADKFTLSVGLAHELEQAMNRNGGWNGGLIKQLVEGQNLSRVRDVLLGRALAAIPIVNGDADPFIPDERFVLVEHKRSGQMELTREGNTLCLNGRKIGFLRSADNLRATVYGDDVREQVAGKTVLNGNVLDLLLENQYLIPEAWKTCSFGIDYHTIVFWGTILRSPNGEHFTRGLSFNGKKWFSTYQQLNLPWLDGYSSAVLV
jgi:hypothetical protein